MEKYLGGLHHPAVYNCEHEALEPAVEPARGGRVVGWSDDSDSSSDVEKTETDDEEDVISGNEATAGTRSAEPTPKVVKSEAKENGTAKKNAR